MANAGDNTISIIDTASNTVTDTVKIRGGPNGIAITPDGTKLYAVTGSTLVMSM
ncbi:hypothetical protein [Methanosarcina horonobensis]|uniref:hypothetical protein n=1 Tax=Methanosarcina horonobensis TaxID=418008 RepID=UPI0022B8ED8F|nr:hypothetical protein [Methanosarcina horonobensis]